LSDFKLPDLQPGDCPSCYGSGKVANDDDQTPWPFWEALEFPANLSVVAGHVQPETCPTCGGTGRDAAAAPVEPSYGYSQEAQRRDVDKAHLKLKALMQHAMMISVEELANLVDGLSELDTVGPILHPTEWRNGRGNLGHWQRVARKALEFRKELQAVVEEEMDAKGVKP
jgi:hypothetical protein